MGSFAEAAVKVREGRSCVAGQWISENLDDDDVAAFETLAKAHRWKTIIQLSDNRLAEKSLIRHVHGQCVCAPSLPTRGCCSGEDHT